MRVEITCAECGTDLTETISDEGVTTNVGKVCENCGNGYAVTITRFGRVDNLSNKYPLVMDEGIEEHERVEGGQLSGN
ncbi:MAG: hypothetical protein ACOCY6_04795 [Halodesulfurarchaeum sp.]